jgi:3-hydroxyisobutyrate dehydrogenase
MSQAKSIGIIGVGNMGGGMARRLLGLGWNVHVRDIDASKTEALRALGATVQETPAALTAAVERLIVCVIDTPQVEAVLFGDQGVKAGLRQGQTVVMCPTLSPEDVESFGQRLQSLGAHMIDAPMSGGPQRAAEGTMSLMVAAPAPVYQANQDLLDALSGLVFHVSERVGDGARTKLANNMLAGINLVGAAQVLAMAQRMGLDLSKTLDVMERSSGQSWISSDRLRRALVNDYAPRAHVTLLEKDTRLAVAAGEAAGFTPELGRLAAAVFAQAHAAGLAEEDDASVFKLYGQSNPS